MAFLCGDIHNESKIKQGLVIGIFVDDDITFLLLSAFFCKLGTKTTLLQITKKKTPNSPLPKIINEFEQLSKVIESRLNLF